MKVFSIFIDMLLVLACLIGGISAIVIIGLILFVVWLLLKSVFVMVIVILIIIALIRS